MRGPILLKFRRKVVARVKRMLAPYVMPRSEIDAEVLAPLREIGRRLTNTDENLHELQDGFAGLEPVVTDLVAMARRQRTLAFQAETLRQRLETLEQQLGTVPFLNGEPYHRFNSPMGRVVGFECPPRSDDPDSPYAGFEDIFRGSAERVTQTQLPYVSLVAGHAPVLDLGCGRGEFLRLLADSNIEAHGVDSDPGMVARCLAAGLPAVQADALDHLVSLPDGTLGTIFCAQVIEHLPVAALQRLLELSRRKLRADGLFIAETINPHSTPALKTFWVDLTHQHPIFPEVALALCGLAGFGSAYVFAPGFEDFEASRFESNSYAVVASVAPLETSR